MTYERFIRCGSAKPVANYYEAVRPSPAHQYFRPRGWSRLCLVWELSSHALLLAGCTLAVPITRAHLERFE
jgi:hypothetical protein